MIYLSQSWYWFISCFKIIKIMQHYFLHLENIIVYQQWSSLLYLNQPVISPFSIKFFFSNLYIVLVIWYFNIIIIILQTINYKWNLNTKCTKILCTLSFIKSTLRYFWDLLNEFQKIVPQPWSTRKNFFINDVFHFTELS